MKKLIVLAVASLFATSAVAGEMKWSGSAGWRYTKTTNDDSMESKSNSGTSTTNAGFGKDVSKWVTNAQQIRANFGMTGGWENVEYGAGLRTGTGSVNSDWQTVNENTDRGIALELAWFRYVHDFGSLDMSATFGRQKNVFAYDSSSENFFDNDVRLDGIGWKFNFGMFGLNLGQYVLGARSQGTDGASTYSHTEASDAIASSQSNFNMLFGFQPHVNWKFSDEIETMLAVGYYVWNDNSYTNRTGGGVDNSAQGNGWASSVTTRGSRPAINSVAFKVNSPRQWQFYNTWTLPYNLKFSAELVKNKDNVYSAYTVTNYGAALPNTKASSTAWAAGLTYGGIKKAHDWTVSYYYGSKGLASVIGAFSNSNFLPDNKGHVLKASYAIADNFVLGWKGSWITEKDKIDAYAITSGTNRPATGLPYTIDLINGAGNQAQEMKTKYMEFTAGVNF